MGRGRFARPCWSSPRIPGSSSESCTSSSGSSSFTKQLRYATSREVILAAWRSFNDVSMLPVVLARNNWGHEAVEQLNNKLAQFKAAVASHLTDPGLECSG